MKDNNGWTVMMLIALAIFSVTICVRVSENQFLQESNLELTTKSYNISKGSGDINYDLFVRPGFTSSVVEGGEINAKIFTPLGKPFE